MTGRYVDDGRFGINMHPGPQIWTGTRFINTVTVRQLIERLSMCDNLDAVVTLGTAPGCFEKVTETVNGYVILDCVDPDGAS